MNLVEYCIKRGGQILPLLIDSKDLKGPSLTNPSILQFENKVLVNLRNTNYTLYHSEKSEYEHFWGPLSYIHPEDDMHLKTVNVICELSEDLKIEKYVHVNTSKCDTNPLWTFVGLEDARLINWEDKLFLCGVRRDKNTTGEGRMELSQLDKNTYEEISRFYIPTPQNKESYCEKNWMPILDLPYKFVKWSNPIEVVETDIKKETCKTIHSGVYTSGYKDWRGGSQLVPWEDYYVAVIHETNLFTTEAGKKNAIYRHRFVVWDKDWNRIALSKEFNFLGGNIEFCCGLSIVNDYFLITFGFQDNASFILKIHESAIEEFINE